jgi:hypothetical protein
MNVFLICLLLSAAFAEDHEDVVASVNDFDESHDYFFKFKDPRSEVAVVSKALISMIRLYFVPNSQKINFLILGQKDGQNLAKKIVTRVFDEVHGEIAMKVSVNYDKTFQETQLNASTIILLESLMEGAAKFKMLGLADKIGNHFKHVLYAPRLSRKNLELFVENQNRLSDVNLLYNSNGSSIELASSIPLAPESYLYNDCFLDDPKTINRFSIHNMRWENDNFFPDKYENFYKCPVEVYFNRDFVNSVSTNIFEALAKQLNFTLKRIELNMTAYLKLHKREKMIEDVHVYGDPGPDFVQSSAIYFDALTLLIPPGEPLTDFEKVVAIFDFETWMAIFATLLLAFILVQVFSWMSSTIQNFVFGRNTGSPFVNLIDIFLNGGQNVSPRRNFARYVLMMFIFWCLIFRTCFQSKTFEHMQKDMRYPRVRTIQELVEKNFTLVSRGVIDDYFISRFPLG